METKVMSRWGTWEELLLSGAVVRHGTHDWNLIAVELRDRIASAYTFTPEVCKGKYEDLQRRYSKSESTALFEELKNTRIVELKKDLERSEDSIGWGTWEELLLGGAVVRHGSQDWNVVAAELQHRNVSPYTFTPEACKAKYENLQRRYSENESTALFEKLKKTRIVELKKSLEPSEDSVGGNEFMGTKIISRWSTWEELLLGGAILRHGTQNWNAVAAEFKDRTVLPSTFTPEVCKAKYEDLQRRYSKNESPAWFEELRKTGMAELKTDLERSEDLIRSLKSKLEFLKAEKNEKKDDYENGSRSPVSHVPPQKLERVEYITKETLKEVSGGSFTDVISSCCKESSTSNCGEVTKSSARIYDQIQNLKKHGYEDMKKILDSIFETKGASTFRRRLDRQKSRKYNKMIRMHMDFDTMKTRIGNQTSNSTLELFRDLLLLINNALVFYSKNTREYKSALYLRYIINKKMREYGAKSLKKEAESPPSMEFLTAKKKVGRPKKSGDGRIQVKEITSNDDGLSIGSCKKTTSGKRKRKDCSSNINEASGEDSTDIVPWWCKRSSSSNRGEVVKSYAGVNDQNRISLTQHGYEDMMDVLGYIWIGGMEWNGVKIEESTAK